MPEILIDTFLDDNIRIFIEYSNNIYIIKYANGRYSDTFINESRTYNLIHDWYMKIINNFSIIRNLNEEEFLLWLRNNR